MNLLMVDDEIGILNILKKVLPWEEIGIQNVYTALNASEAERILTQQQIDVMLCDIEMPQKSGLELIKWVQGLYPEIINIILTGHADFNYARDAISLGVYRYLLKPVSFEEVADTLKAALELAGKGKSRDRKENAADTDGDSPVKTVRDYLEQHYNEVITRKDVERLVHLNTDYLNRTFKMELGYTLMEYIQHCRVREAKKMLIDTDKSIAQICQEVGYDSPPYFSKIFKKNTGISPVDYRKNHGAEVNDQGEGQ